MELRDVAGVAGSGSVVLKGTLVVPERCAGLVVFAHGSGSSRMSPRNRMVARVLQDKGEGGGRVLGGPASAGAVQGGASERPKALRCLDWGPAACAHVTANPDSRAWPLSRLGCLAVRRHGHAAV